MAFRANVASLSLLFFFYTVGLSNAGLVQFPAGLKVASVNNNSPRFWPGHSETLTLGALQSVGLCTETGLRVPLHCVKYHYNASHIVEAFVADKKDYEEAQKGGSADDFDFVGGRNCLASECSRRVEIDDASSWCLVFMNLDPLLRENVIQYRYDMCLSEEDKDTALVVLLSTCGFLVLSLCMCGVCCYRHSIRKRSPETYSGTVLIPYELVPDNGDRSAPRVMYAPKNVQFERL